MKHAVDWSLYLVTDRDLARGRPIEDVVDSAVRGGVSVVQIREKECSTLEYINLVKKIKDITDPRGIPLIVNDRLDVAQASGADGVHVGQYDMPYEEARRILGSQAIIGLTVETPEQAAAAESLVWESDPNTILTPLPGFPRIFSFGTFTLSRKTSPVGEERDPNFSRSVVEIPFIFLGSIINADNPLLPASLSEYA